MQARVRLRNIRHPVNKVGMGKGLCFSFLLLWSTHSCANYAALMAIERSNSQSESVVMPSGESDGFIETGNFYRDGPEILFCKEKAAKLEVREGEGGCFYKHRVTDSFLSKLLGKYELEISRGVRPQEYLDFVFGFGQVEFVGLGSKEIARSTFTHKKIIISYLIKGKGGENESKGETENIAPP